MKLTSRQEALVRYVLALREDGILKGAGSLPVVLQRVGRTVAADLTALFLKMTAEKMGGMFVDFASILDGNGKST